MASDTAKQKVRRVIAEHADDNGIAAITTALLAEEAKLSRRTVEYALRELLADKVIAKRYTPDHVRVLKLIA